MFRPKLNVEFGVNDAVAVGVNIYDLYFADGVYNAKSGADEVKDSGLGLLFPITFNPYITFAVNEDATVGVDVLLKVNTEGSDVFGVGFKPSAEFSLGSGAKFVVYDEIIFYGNSKAYGKDADQDFVKEHYRAGYIALNGTDPDNPSPIANTTANTLQFDFVWTF
jgi:hypothetical protein